MVNAKNKIFKIKNFSFVFLLIFIDNCYSDFIKCIGPCIELNNCRSAKKSIKENGVYPEICNFNNSEPFVCCGIEDEKTLYEKYIVNARKSLRKCNEFYPPNIPGDYENANVGAFAGYTVFGNEFPFMAVLGYGDIKNPMYTCGGFLVDRNVVITAAHCAKVSGLIPTVVRIGSYPLRSDENKPIRVLRAIIHPNYDSETNINDIGILFLAQNSKEIPACLVHSNSSVDFKSDGRGIAIGYGTTSFAGPFSKELIKVYVNVIENKICQEEYKNFPISKSQLCALGVTRIFENKTTAVQDTCQGDSGGPLILHSNRKQVIGIISYGRSCGTELPGIYTNIDSYLDWIETIIWSEDNQNVDNVYFA